MGIQRNKLHACWLHIWFASVVASVFIVSIPLLGQNTESPEVKPGSIVGTVLDVNGDTVPQASVVFEGTENNDRRSVVANDNGFFEFHEAKPGISYRITISAEGFAGWTSAVTVEPGQFKILTDIQLRIPQAQTTVNVTETAEEIATAQVKQEEKQRVLGFVPNFYVVYEPNPVPLTRKLKFRLAAKVATDPVTALGVAFLAGTQQAGDTPDYGQGAAGFGKRFGADAADGFTDIMIGGAILPSLLHQDPRYFYQGTGTNKSRMRHALFHPFVCKGDNGHWQPNYSSLGGDLASSAISNTYYPESNRGTGLVFANFAISTAERVASSLAQEFILRRIHAPGQ